MSDRKLKIMDLFAGTGAFSYAFTQNKMFTCVFANDFASESKLIYEVNHSGTKYELEDIHNLTVENIPKHNILCGGFPCQPFSIAGEKKGFEDERSNVFFKIIEILKFHKPEIVILENVKNLKTHDKGNTFQVIEECLTDIGYYVKYSILDTSKITKIPQHRERIYIVCFRDKKLYDNFDFDFKNVKTDNILDYLEDNIDEKYYYTDRFKCFDTIKNGVTKHIEENVLYQYRRYYVRENKSKVCPTLTANMGTGGTNVPLLLDDKGIRKLTPRECFNLQGFPKDYKLPKISDSKLYKLAGNAISIPVLKLIVEKLVDILG